MTALVTTPTAAVETPSPTTELAIPRGADPETAILGPINGRYDLLERIAKGGMGIVYRAIDRLLNRTVAVKVLRSRYVDRPDLLRRFLSEARINGRLQHPGVVPVYEVGNIPDGRPFIAMKLIEGRTLTRLLRERKDSGDNLAHFLKVFETLCQTVAYAHQQGVIHRDLKPDNIMVGEFGEVQVMDWGLAKFLDPAAAIAPIPDGFASVEISAGLSRDGLTPVPGTMTQPTAVMPVGPDHSAFGYTVAGEVFGTLAYMPPEQARGETDLLNRRGDVFALGAILCEILTGHPPYFGAPESLREMARAGKLFGAFVLLDRSGADPDLVRLAKHCLAAERNDRPADAAALATMVTQCLDGMRDRHREIEVGRLTAEARVAEAEARERLARQARRMSRMLAVAGVIVAGLLAAGLGWYANDRSARAADEAHRRAVALDQIDGALDEAETMDEEARRLTDRPFARDAAARRAVAACQRAEALFGTVAYPPEDFRERFVGLNARVRDTERWTSLAAALIQWRAELFDGRGRFDATAAARRCGEILEAHGFDVLDRNPIGAGDMIFGHPAADTVRDALADWLALTPDAAVRNHLAAVLRAIGHPAADAWLAALDANTPDALARLAGAGVDREIPAVGIAVAARRLVESNRLDAAERLLGQGVRRHPNDYAVNLLFGILLRGKTDAIRHLTVARASRPNDPVVAMELAGAFADVGRTHEALDVYRAVLDTDPKSAAAHKAIGGLLLTAGDLPGAVSAYRSAAKCDPADADVHLRLGAAYEKLNDPANAATAYATAANLRPKDTTVLVALGRNHEKAGNLIGAVEAYRFASRLSPTDVEVCHEFGRLLASSANESAVAELARLAADWPADGDVWDDLGKARLQFGQFRAAAAAFRAAAERFLDDGARHNSVLSSARKATRMAALEQRIPLLLAGEYVPVSADGWAQMGDVCRRTRHYATAAKFFAEAAERDDRFAAPAAVCAALAGFGCGTDAAAMSDKEREQLRSKALIHFHRSPAAVADPILDQIKMTATAAGLTDEERMMWQEVWPAAKR